MHDILDMCIIDHDRLQRAFLLMQLLKRGNFLCLFKIGVVIIYKNIKTIIFS